MKAIMDVPNAVEYSFKRALLYTIIDVLGRDDENHDEKAYEVAGKVFDLVRQYEGGLVDQNQYFQKLLFDKVVMAPPRPIFVDKSVLDDFGILGTMNPTQSGDSSVDNTSQCKICLHRSIDGIAPVCHEIGCPVEYRKRKA